MIGEHETDTIAIVELPGRYLAESERTSPWRSLSITRRSASRLFRRLRALTLSLPVIGMPVAALAATDTDTLTVTATVQSACSLNGGTMSFGQYLSGQATNLDVSGQINYVNCSGTLSFELDGGQSGNVASRAMASGANRLTYQLYRTAQRTAVWGTGSDAQTQQLLVPQSGSITVYGRVPSSQAVPAGSYADTVNVTMTF